MKFPKLVIEEATALRENATQREKDRLNFINLDPEHFERCIYGQMTGSCYNSRAIELIQKSASKVYNNNEHRYMNGEKSVYQGVVLNGSPKETDREFYFSPIEVFISRANANKDYGANEKLIQFIKGEIKSL